MINKTPEERKAISKKIVATRKANIAKRKAEQEEMRKHADALYWNIQALQDQLSKLEALQTMQVLSDKLIGRGLLRHDQIVGSSMPWTEASGVYFLIHDNNIIYVGQSVNIYARIPQHHDKKFDRYAYIPCKPHLLNILESLYIHCLQPKLNVGDNGTLYAPLTLNKLLEQAHDMAVPAVPQPKAPRPAKA